jgi:hypothetical protein
VFRELERFGFDEFGFAVVYFQVSIPKRYSIRVAENHAEIPLVQKRCWRWHPGFRKQYLRGSF